MAQVLESPETPDWNVIQSYYLKGKTPKQIEALTGIQANRVSVRASRYGWTQALHKTKSTVQVSVQHDNDKEQESPLARQSERTRTALADLLVRSAETLASVPLLSASRALRVNQDAEAMVRNAKVVFGWNDGASSPAVRISILGSAIIDSQVSAHSPKLNDQSTPTLHPPIDVESSPKSTPE